MVGLVVFLHYMGRLRSQLPIPLVLLVILQYSGFLIDCPIPPILHRRDHLPLHLLPLNQPLRHRCFAGKRSVGVRHGDA